MKRGAHTSHSHAASEKAQRKKNLSPSEMKNAITETSSIVRRALSGPRPDMVKVIMLGFAGSSKTTLLHIIAGKRVYGFNTDYGLVLDVKPEDRIRNGNRECFIGHGVDAETFLPNQWEDPVNMIMPLDCPGFVDTDKFKRLINSFSIDQILESGGKIKVMLVVSEMQMTERAIEAFKAFDILCEMFPDFEELARTICVVITKTTIDEPVKLMNRLAGSKVRHNALIDYLASEEGKKQIFTVPAVREEGEFKYEGRERLIKHLRKNPMINPRHCVAIDDEAAKHMDDIGKTFFEQMREGLKKMVDMFGTKTKSEDIGELRAWQGYAERILQAKEERGFEGICSCCEEINELRICSEPLAQVRPWNEFVSRSLSRVPKLQGLCEKSKLMMETAMTALKKNEESLSDKIQQIEYRNRVEAEKAEMNERIRKGEAKIEEYSEKMKQLEADSKRRQEEYEAKERERKAVIDGLKDQIARMKKEDDDAKKSGLGNAAVQLGKNTVEVFVLENPAKIPGYFKSCWDFGKELGQKLFG